MLSIGAPRVSVIVYETEDAKIALMLPCEIMAYWIKVLFPDGKMSTAVIQTGTAPRHAVDPAAG